MLYIRCGSHFVLRGILLSLEGNTIRVALEECGDAAEYRRVENGWISENGDPVEIEFQAMPKSEPLDLMLMLAEERSTPQYCVV